MRLSLIFLNFTLAFIITGCANLKSVSTKLEGVLDKPDKNRKKFTVAWIKNLDPEYSSGNLPIGTSSPFVHEGILYMGNLSGEMTAYQLSNGRELWSVNENQPLNATANVFNDILVYGSKEGRLFARNYYTGKRVYALDLDAPIESPPIFHGGRMFIHLRDHRIVCLDAATGKVFWSYQRSVPYPTTLQRVSKVLPYKNRIIVGFADGNITALSVEEGIILWEQRISSGVKFIDVDVEPIYFGGYVIAGAAAGEMKFLNPENGTIIRSIPLTLQTKPVRLKNTLLVGTVFGEVALVDESGKILKRRKFLNSGISSLAKWKDGIVATSMSGEILFLDPASLEVKETYNLGHEQSAVFGQVTVSNNYLSLYSSRNRLYVFR